MLMIIATSDYWDQKIVLSEEAIGELEFWLFNIHCLTPRRFRVHRKLPDKIVYTDASNYACEGYLVESNSKIVHKMWSESEASKSSTHRELLAVLITIESLKDDFSNCLVKLYTDNQNVVRITQAGSMKHDLHSLATSIFNLCIRRNITLEVEWVPRDFNLQADYFSKIFDYNDWSVNDVYFNYFNGIWGPFECDLFADFNNHKLPTFFSPYWCPGTSGVDAFGQNWSSFNCWIVPPIH